MKVISCEAVRPYRSENGLLGGPIPLKEIMDDAEIRVCLEFTIQMRKIQPIEKYGSCHNLICSQGHTLIYTFKMIEFSIS